MVALSETPNLKNCIKQSTHKYGSERNATPPTSNAIPPILPPILPSILPPSHPPSFPSSLHRSVRGHSPFGGKAIRRTLCLAGELLRRIFFCSKKSRFVESFLRIRKSFGRIFEVTLAKICIEQIDEIGNGISDLEM